MQKALFLDRDGTLNIDNWYTFKTQDCRLVDANLPTILKRIQELGFLLVVITNQSGIGRGFYTEKEFWAFMEELEKQLWLKFDRVYFCPYHPSDIRSTYLRKPNNGMLLRAIDDLKIDIKNSYLIWDTITDIIAWQKTSCKTILYNWANMNTIWINPDFCINKWEDVMDVIF